MEVKVRKGFTLIELLVVVLIIGILAAIALPQYERTVNRVRVAELQNLAKPLTTAQEAYFLETGEYSRDFEYLAVSAPGNGKLSYREGRQVLVYPKGNRVEINGTNGQVYAYNPDLELQITMAADYDGWGCGAGTNNKDMQAVCKNATGLSTGKNTNCSFGPCIFYSLMVKK